MLAASAADDKNAHGAILADLRRGPRVPGGGRPGGYDSDMICELMGASRGLAVAALGELRPDVEDLGQRIIEQQHSGYRLAGVVVAGEGSAVAVAGFRVATNLAWGRHLYVDDLVTRTAFRGQGHGRALMTWLVEQARHDGCGQLHLDSGVGDTRHDAHALYHAAGLRITSHHFQREVPADGPPPELPSR